MCLFTCVIIKCKRRANYVICRRRYWKTEGLRFIKRVNIVLKGKPNDQ